VRLIHPNSKLALKIIKKELTPAQTIEKALSSIQKSDSNYTYKLLSVYNDMLTNHKL
jgi:hypothetical protein